VSQGSRARRLQYGSAASGVLDSLPVGNGVLGALLDGGMPSETIAVSHGALWPGAPGAEPLGRVELDYPGYDIASCRRVLDLGRAVHDVTTTDGDGAVLARRSFASAPAGALVYRISSSRRGGVTVTVRLGSPHGYDEHPALAGALLITGRAPSHVRASPGSQDVTCEAGGGTGFALALAARPAGGTIRRDAGSLVIEGADAVVLAVVAGTTFRRWDAGPGIALPDIAYAVLRQAREVARRDIGDLEAEHVRDYAGLFGRVSLRLGPESGPESGPGGGPGRTAMTDERLRLAGTDPDLAALLFDYGRYLLIASSRPGSPVNIGTQMSYWPAETTGLPECHEPLVDLIEQLAESGSGPGYAGWAMGGAWLCRHLWQHYEFSGDRRLLSRIYPLLAGASRFVLGMLTEGPGGYLAVSPAPSAGHRCCAADGGLAAVTAGTAMDYWITSELFGNTLSAAGELGVTGDPVLEEIRKASGQLRRPGAGPDGTLLERDAALPGEDPGHRHLSHLYGVYPGAQAHQKDRDLYLPARQALQRRLDHGAGDTSWSLAWVIALLARFGDGDAAHARLQLMTRRFLADNLLALDPSTAGECFQAGGSLGVTAAITEMLLASHRDSIDVLPALPAAWPDGSVTGLRTRHRVDVGIRWDHGAVSELVLTAREDVAVAVTFPRPPAPHPATRSDPRP